MEYPANKNPLSLISKKYPGEKSTLTSCQRILESATFWPAVLRGNYEQKCHCFQLLMTLFNNLSTYRFDSSKYNLRNKKRKKRGVKN